MVMAEDTEELEKKCTCEKPLPGSRGICMRCGLRAFPAYVECPVCRGCGAVQEVVLKRWKKLPKSEEEGKP